MVDSSLKLFKKVRGICGKKHYGFVHGSPDLGNRVAQIDWIMSSAAHAQVREWLQTGITHLYLTILQNCINVGVISCLSTVIASFFSPLCCSFAMWPSIVLICIAGTALAQQPSASSAPSNTSSSPAAQSSPAWLSDVKPLPGNVQSYPTNDTDIPVGPLSNTSITLQGYPDPWVTPSTNSSEVQAVISALDWSNVPSVPVRKANSDGSVNMGGYDQSDPDCWWSATGCTQPKHPGIPPDVKNCPKVGDWGLVSPWWCCGKLSLWLIMMLMVMI